VARKNSKSDMEFDVMWCMLHDESYASIAIAVTSINLV
jgi:hypothetical protein